MDLNTFVVAVIDLFSSPWVWLILFASVLYAAGNYIDELLLSKYEQDVGTLVIISTLFAGLIALLFFAAAPFFATSVYLEQKFIYLALLIGALEALWLIPYLYATERSGAIVAGPLFQAVPVFALGMEATLGIMPPSVQIVGACIVVAGGILVSIEREEDTDGNTSHKIDWITLGMMSLSAILVAAIYVLFRNVALETNFIATGFWVALGTLASGAALYIFWEPYRASFNSFCHNANYKALGVQFINEILDAGGVYMSHLATILGPSVMVVSAFNATQPLFIGAIGALLLFLGVGGVSTERASGSAWRLLVLGIILIAIGIVVIALGSSG